MTLSSPTERLAPPDDTPTEAGAPPKRWRRVRPIARDHALALQRFIGGVQMLGAATLVSAYAAGADAVGAPAAGGILVALGLLQLVTGAVWLIVPRPLQRSIKRWPGRYVAVLLAFAIAVIALGGSNADAAWVTSSQCALIAAGVALPGLRLIPAALLVTVAASGIWIAVDGTTGGHDHDGRYLVAILAMAKVVVVGLWLGRGTGIAIAVLDRWHVIELDERGAIGRLRELLGRVDRKAAALGRVLSAVARPSAELAALRVRLRRGVDLPEAGTTVSIGQIVDELIDELDAWSEPLALRTEVAGDVEALAVDAVFGAEIAAVARRQIDNVARHAPAAKQVTLTIDRTDGHLRVVLTDDGGGTAPTRTGAGTTWSARQLERAGGSTRYFTAREGVGLELLLPLSPHLELSDAPALSVTDSLQRFGYGLFTPLRWAGYIGDSVYVQSVDGIGERWLLMPIGALLIEYVMQRGLPGRRLDAHGRVVVASLLGVLLVAVFTIPADSPDAIVPATTSVVVISNLLLTRRIGTWALLEAARFAAFLPLFIAVGAPSLSLGLVYPAAFYAVAFGLTIFIRQAGTLEGSVLDAVGRAALASATVRGLALHHDAIDVILRAAPDTPEVTAAGEALDDAVIELANTSEATLDPRAIVRGALEAAIQVPVVVTHEPEADWRPARVDIASALGRIALVEVASLAGDERASCAPPGLLGRRRLQALHATWGGDGGTQLTLRAEPQLRPPDIAKVRELERVGRALGVAVDSRPDALRLTYRS